MKEVRQDESRMYEYELGSFIACDFQRLPCYPQERDPYALWAPYDSPYAKRFLPCLVTDMHDP